MNVNIDYVGKEASKGSVAQHLVANSKLEPGRMRPWIGKDGGVYVTVHTGGDRKDPANYKSVPVMANGTLRRDEWKQLDEAVRQVAEQRLVGFQDLIDRGLTYNLGNAMGTTVLEHHKMSDALEAELSMDAVTRTQGDRVEFSTEYLPIPIVHCDYEINERVLETSRRMGNPLETLQAERAARKVSEELEKMLFTDTKHNYGSGKIKSFINFDDRNEYSLDDNWDASGVSGKDIIEDVLGMKQMSIDNYHYGPWVLYIPTKYETKLDEDYDDTRGNTIRERILAIQGIQDIKVVDMLPANNVLLVQTTSDVVRIVRGMDLQNVQWETEGGFVHKFKALTIQVPQIRSDDNGRCGVVHGS